MEKAKIRMFLRTALTRVLVIGLYFDANIVT